MEYNSVFYECVRTKGENLQSQRFLLSYIIIDWSSWSHSQILLRFYLCFQLRTCDFSWPKKKNLWFLLTKKENKNLWFLLMDFKPAMYNVKQSSTHFLFVYFLWNCYNKVRNISTHRILKDVSLLVD
jgi:hypothetical protein